VVWAEVGVKDPMPLPEFLLAQARLQVRFSVTGAIGDVAVLVPDDDADVDPARRDRGADNALGWIAATSRAFGAIARARAAERKRCSDEIVIYYLFFKKEWASSRFCCMFFFLKKKTLC
jgi:hypothetical protein